MCNDSCEKCQDKAHNFLANAFGLWGKVVAKLHFLILAGSLSGFIYATMNYLGQPVPVFLYSTWMPTVSIAPFLFLFTSCSHQ